MPIISDLEKYRTEKNYSQELLARYFGVSQQTYSNIESGRRKKLSPEEHAKVEHLVKNRPVLTLNDVTGEVVESLSTQANKPRSPFRDAVDLGAWNEDDPTEEHRGKEFIDLGNGKYLLYTPLVTHVASMGYLRGYSDPEWLDELPKHAITVDRIPAGIYRTFVARGQSMFDGSDRSIHNNSKVTGRVIRQDLYRDSKLHLHKFQLFVVVHKDGITIKQITNHDVEKGTITIHSWNPDKKEFPDMELELKDVLQLLNVIRIERDL